ncbi:MAG: DUF4342 domain-containing protein [Oscillospiraceae bacterium]|nr:DUF4342 domain-containing protein [Oscillospiraceae bacterium]
MEPMEMIEKLREKANVTYDEARGVLESVNWNLIDALVALEKEGKLKEDNNMSYSTKKESYADYSGTCEQCQKDGSFIGFINKAGKWIGKVIMKGMENKLCIERKGEKIIELPVTVLVLIMIPAFYLIICALIVAFFMGCKFRFTGPDLGCDKVNNVMDKIEFSSPKEESQKNNQEYDINDHK